MTNPVIEKIEIHNHYNVDLSEIEKHLHVIINKLNHISMTQAEATEKINGLTTQLGKVKTEVEALIAAAQNQGNVSPELEAAITSAQAALQGVDDLNPDAQP